MVVLLLSTSHIKLILTHYSFDTLNTVTCDKVNLSYCTIFLYSCSLIHHPGNIMNASYVLTMQRTRDTVGRKIHTVLALTELGLIEGQ